MGKFVYELTDSELKTAYIQYCNNLWNREPLKSIRDNKSGQLAGVWTQMDLLKECAKRFCCS